MTDNARITGRKTLASTRWLSLETLYVEGRDGRQFAWDTVTRAGDRGAACMVATIFKDGVDHVILVRQFRPPVGGLVVEFPAGLIDEGEDPASTAVRELAEETGYVGEVVAMGPPVYSSPGLTSEKVRYVEMRVTGQAAQQLDGEEDIEVLLVPRANLLEELAALDKPGQHIDAKLWFYAGALAGR